MLEIKSQAMLSLLAKAALYPVAMELKDRIRTARRAIVPKVTQEDIAEALGISPQAVSGWERGEAGPDADKFPALAKLLKVDVGWLHGEEKAISDETDATTPVLVPGDQLQASGRPDFKIYASAEGGPGQIILTSEPVDFQPRPTILQNVRDAYGVIISGDSMAPEYRAGDTALVNPHLPAIGDEVYIFYAERHGEARATIKHLRRATPDKWFVTQHNPPPDMDKDFILSRKEWRIAHRVLGKYSRR